MEFLAAAFFTSLSLVGLATAFLEAFLAISGAFFSEETLFDLVLLSKAVDAIGMKEEGDLAVLELRDGMDKSFVLLLIVSSFRVERLFSGAAFLLGKLSARSA